jgi:hypothetical protein
MPSDCSPLHIPTLLTYSLSSNLTSLSLTFSHLVTTLHSYESFKLLLKPTTPFFTWSLSTDLPSSVMDFTLYNLTRDEYHSLEVSLTNLVSYPYLTPAQDVYLWIPIDQTLEEFKCSGNFTWSMT